MPDISMCRNTRCPLKERCYRYTAKPNPFRQSYGSFTFDIDQAKEGCDHFWDNGKNQKQSSHE